MVTSRTLNAFALAIFMLLGLPIFAMEKAPDFRDEVDPLLTRPRTYPSVPICEDLVPQAKRELAHRIADIVAGAVSDVIWKERAELSETRKRWRALAINSIWVSVYQRLIDGADAKGLSTAHVTMAKGIAKQTGLFVSDFCQKRASLEAQSEQKMSDPVHKLAGAAAHAWTAPAAEHQAHIKELTQDVVAWASKEWLTSRALMGALRLIIENIPAASGESVPSASAARFLATQNQACYEIGAHVCTCIDSINRNWLSGFKKVAISVTSSLLPNAELGAQILGGLEDIIIDEESRVVPLAEQLVRIMAAQSSGPQINTPGEPDFEREKAEFKAFLDAKVPALIASLLKNDSDGQVKKLLKGWIAGPATSIAEALKPFVMELVCNEKARGAQHLLFNYLPAAFFEHVHPNVNPTRLNEEAAKVSYGLGGVAHDVAQTYLWKEDQELSQFRPIFMKAIRATTEQITYALLSGNGEGSAESNAVRSARSLTALHLFFEDYAKVKKGTGNFRVNLDDDLNQPVIDLTTYLLQVKYPHEAEIHKRIHLLLRDGSDAFFGTIIDRITLINLVCNFDFPIETSKASPAAPRGAKSSAIDPSFHGPFGKSVIRALRSFLNLSGQLGWLNAFLLGAVNKAHESVGKKILSGDSGNYVESLNRLFFKQGGEHAGEARPFVEWVNDPEALNAKFELWVNKKLTPFLQRQVAELVPLGTQTATGLFVGSLVPGLVLELKNIIWAENQRLLRILLFYYLLPLWRDDIIAAANKQKL